MFTTLIFRKLFSRYIKIIRVIFAGASFLIILYTCETLSHGIMKIDMITYDVMCVFFMLYSFYYFYLVMKDDAHIVISRSPEFWIVAGMLFFYFGTTAENIFRGKLSDIMIGDHNLTHYISNVLDLIFYGFCWNYAFICMKWLTKTSRN